MFSRVYRMKNAVYLGSEINRVIQFCMNGRIRSFEVHMHICQGNFYR